MSFETYQMFLLILSTSEHAKKREVDLIRPQIMQF